MTTDLFKTLRVHAPVRPQSPATKRFPLNPDSVYLGQIMRACPAFCELNPLCLSRWRAGAQFQALAVVPGSLRAAEVPANPVSPLALARLRQGLWLERELTPFLREHAGQGRTQVTRKHTSILRQVVLQEYGKRLRQGRHQRSAPNDNAR